MRPAETVGSTMDAIVQHAYGSVDQLTFTRTTRPSLADDEVLAHVRAAGLDRLRILPADPQTGQGTSIAAGKYVTRRLYAEIVTDGQGYSATQVEFQVTRWLSLLSSISTLGRQSANMRVSRDY